MFEPPETKTWGEQMKITKTSARGRPHGSYAPCRPPDASALVALPAWGRGQAAQQHAAAVLQYMQQQRPTKTLNEHQKRPCGPTIPYRLGPGHAHEILGRRGVRSQITGENHFQV